MSVAVGAVQLATPEHKPGVTFIVMLPGQLEITGNSLSTTVTLNEQRRRSPPRRNPCAGSLSRQRGRDFPTILGQFLHRRLVEPDVHLGAAVEVAGVTQLARQFLAVVEARIDPQQLHQIDDRGSPVEVLPLTHLGQVGFDIDVRNRGRLGLRRERGSAFGKGGTCRGRRRLGLVTEDRVLDRTENTHGMLSWCRRMAQ